MTTTPSNQPFVFHPSLPSANSAPAARSRPSQPSDALVQATSREITAIIREIAVAAKQVQPVQKFFALFADRVQRAMAGQGVTIWQFDRSNEQFTPLVSIGACRADSIAPESKSVQQNLLRTIVADGQPAVVPPTVGATHEDSVLNPTEFPVAIVPIESEQTAAEKFVLQVFLDAGAGVTTQRGFLRFSVQMADLAGEFVRATQLRELFAKQELVRRVDDAVLRLHQPVSSERIEAITADLAAEVFDLDQAAVCYINSGTARLVAANHVNEIDHNSPAANRLQMAAENSIGSGCVTQLRIDAAESNLTHGLVVAPDGAGAIRVVGLRDRRREGISETYASELARFVTHADMALKHAGRLESIPGMRMLSSLSPSVRNRGKRYARPVTIMLLGTALLLLVFFPMPIVVNGTGIVRPAERQSLSVPRDAIARMVHVDHGQNVTAGTPLITLDDPELTRKITQLVGRKSVLLQQADRLNTSLIEAQGDRREQVTQIEGQLQLAKEETASIDSQLALLNEIQSSLVIRSDRNGTVDGWRLHERLAGRPLRRGDHLLHIVAQNSDWIVEARIPQNRLNHVKTARGDKDFSALVSLDAEPNQNWHASLLRLGPSTAEDENTTASTAALLRLQREAWTVEDIRGEYESKTGAPVRVAFRCGHAAAGYLLFQDLIRNLQGTYRMYVGPASESVLLENES